MSDRPAGEGGSKPHPLIAAIMAGGQGTRLGRDKAALTYGGATFLERVAAVALELVDRVLVVGRSEPPANWPFERVGFRRDLTPGQGPAGGLLTALHSVEGEVLALACDTPKLDAGAVRWLLEARRDLDLDLGLVVTCDGQLEPLFAIYSQAVVPLMAARLRAGRRSLHGLIEAHGDRFRRLPAPSWVASRLLNINQADDLARLERGEEGR